MSRETDSLQAYFNNSGLTHVVTAIQGTYVSSQDPCHPHAPGSYHCRQGTGGHGLAIDVADHYGSRDTPGLLALRNALRPVEAQCAEIIYAGPGHPPCIKNGQPYTYDQQTMDGHHNHVHVAVEQGVFLVWQSPLTGGWTEHPTIEVEVAYKPVDVQIPTDDQGNGWLKVPYQIDQIISHLPPGLRPGTDGHYLGCEVGLAQEDPGTIVSVIGWAPHTEAVVRIRVTA